MSVDDEEALEKVNEIWKDDLLGRREEAEFLIRFIDSVVANPGSGREGQGFTIGIDAGYGEGKTFFLTRLEQHLKIDHSVAFIDAWADDLADQPLVALMATLKSAIGSKLDDPDISSKWDSFLNKGGEIVKIGAIGAMKRGLGLLISYQAVEGIGQVFSNPSDDFSTRAGDAARDISSDIMDGFNAQLKLSRPMDEQIKEFNEGKDAIKAAKDSLAALAKNIENEKPIVIIIDELDRCRPTYAIKLLEEIKHLFDVPGMVFILGLHGDQLGHSVRGAYGPTFDGHTYLHRFINRRYSLVSPTKEKLISEKLEELKFIKEKFLPLEYFRQIGQKNPNYFDITKMIDNYSYIFNLSARDTLKLIDHISYSVSVLSNGVIIPEFFIPLAVSFIKNIEPYLLWDPNKIKNERYEFRIDRHNNIYKNSKDIFQTIDSYNNLDDRDFSEVYENHRNSGGVVTDILLLNYKKTRDQERLYRNIQPRDYLSLISLASRIK